MTEFAQQITEELARKIPTASMGTIVGGGRMEPMYYYPDDPEEKEYSLDDLWDALSEEEQEKMRDIAYCCFYHMAPYGWSRIMASAFEEYCEREGK